MSLKLKSPSELMGYQIKEETDIQGASLKKKRAPAPLTISCPICGGPAPDHIHFGGESGNNIIVKYMMCIAPIKTVLCTLQ